jgi:hypothetical protein
MAEGIPFHAEDVYNPSDRGSHPGGSHLVVDAPLHEGRLHRDAGDPLCKPAKKFWGLTGRHTDRVSCHTCVRMALRLGLPFDGDVALDFGRSWSIHLIIEHGRLDHIELANRWFRIPPVEPPTLPDVDRLLREVQTIDPRAQKVVLGGFEQTSPYDWHGIASVS